MNLPSERINNLFTLMRKIRFGNEHPIITQLEEHDLLIEATIQYLDELAIENNEAQVRAFNRQGK